MVEDCRYLRITISSKNKDLDLKRKMRNMYANDNLFLSFLVALLVYNAVYLRPTALHKLCTYVVRLHQNILKKLKVAYNNSLRRFMKIQWRNSACEMFGNLNNNLFDEML